MEHQADLVPGFAVLLESLLGDQTAGADPCAQFQLFQNLPGTRVGGGFAGLDVASREVEIAVFKVFAEKNRTRTDDQGSGDDLDVVWWGLVHWVTIGWWSVAGKCRAGVLYRVERTGGFMVVR